MSESGGKTVGRGRVGSSQGKLCYTKIEKHRIGIGEEDPRKNFDMGSSMVICARQEVP